MSNEKDIVKLEDMAQKRDTILEEANFLSEEDSVKKYLELIDRKNSLDSKIEELFIKIKFTEYSKCNHLWIETSQDNPSNEYVLTIGCVKCGVDTTLMRKLARNKNKPMTLEEKAMREYLLNGSRVSYDFIDEVCDLELAKAIYRKVNERYPDLDNQTLGRYILNALKDMREIQVSEERVTNRVKRLRLNPDFNNWKGKKEKLSKYFL